LEAHHSDLPLIVLSADRPERLRFTGANQTTNQINIFNCGRFYSGDEYVLYADGPTHINLEFDEPLLSDDNSNWLADLEEKELVEADITTELFEVPAGRGIVIVGHDGIDVAEFAENLGVPVIAENPLSYAEAVTHASLFSAKLEIDWAVVVGRTTLSRSTNALIAKAKNIYVIDPRAAKVDPKRSATKIFSEVPTIVGSAESWEIESDFIEISGWNEPAVAQCIAANLPYGSTLYVSSSRPIRDFEAFSKPRDGVEVFANRGLAGIDGNLSTALGIASKRECTYAVVGDLAFLHDLTALVNQENIKLKLIVINNDGGGIFSTLPQAGIAGFEKIFGTPHGQDLFEIASAFKLPVTEIDDLKTLKQFMDPPVGFEIGVLQMPSREENAAFIRELAQRVNYR
jgi:2-succinyl-5-enolpyruvyl-6-hydroxy-3-cyclohexene-1-carboxylate synthase